MAADLGLVLKCVQARNDAGEVLVWRRGLFVVSMLPKPDIEGPRTHGKILPLRANLEYPGPPGLIQSIYLVLGIIICPEALKAPSETAWGKF